MFKHIPIQTPIMETAHFDGKHFYSINGEKFPSITTILHSFPNKNIEIWKARTPNWKEIQDESFKVGTDLHKIIENYLKNKTFEESTNHIDVPENYKIYPLNLFYNLQPKLNKIDNIQCIESYLYEPNLKIAGCTDCIADFDGEKCIIDFKQSRKKKLEKYINDYKLQVTGYSKMFEYCTKQKIDLGIILIANWDGTTSTFKVNIPDFEDQLIDVLKQYEMLSM